MKKTILLFSILIFFYSLSFAAEAEKLRVTGNNANIRSRPDLGAEIVLKAAKGDIFSVAGKEGNWYKILIPGADGSQETEAFINSSLGEIVGQEGVSSQNVQKNPARKPAGKSKTPHRVARGDEKLFSGFYAKLGLLTSPKVDGIGDRWLLDFGRDWAIINPFLATGFEVQPYYRHFSSGDFTDSILGANIFANAKGGVNIGRFVEKLNFLTPYIGFGLGGAFIKSNSKLGANKFGRTNFYFAWHLMFGFEVALKNMDLILELQTVKVSVPETSPDAAQHFLMLGVRF
jgi:opacity protein-like surface antigen